MLLLEFLRAFFGLGLQIDFGMLLYVNPKKEVDTFCIVQSEQAHPGEEDIF